MAPELACMAIQLGLIRLISGLSFACMGFFWGEPKSTEPANAENRVERSLKIVRINIKRLTLQASVEFYPQYSHPTTAL